MYFFFKFNKINFKSKCKTNRQKFKSCSDKTLIPRQEIRMNKRDDLKDILYLISLTQMLKSQKIKPSISKPFEQDESEDSLSKSQDKLESKPQDKSENS